MDAGTDSGVAGIRYCVAVFTFTAKSSGESRADCQRTTDGDDFGDYRRADVL